MMMIKIRQLTTKLHLKCFNIVHSAGKYLFHCHIQQGIVGNRRPSIFDKYIIFIDIYVTFVSVIPSSIEH